MKISVIIPVYNVEQYLDRCINSIRHQISDDSEIILVDDGSTDSSGIICDKYKLKDNKIKVIHQKNGGLSAARNAGIRKAQGEYLIFIDSDDFVAPDLIVVVSQIINSNSPDIINWGYNIVDEQGNIVSRNSFYKSELLPNSEALNLLLLDEKINNFAWANAYKRSLFNSIEYPVGVLYEDKYTTYKLFGAAHTVYCINKCLYNYIIRAGSICNSTNTAQTIKGAVDNFRGLVAQYQYAKSNHLSSVVSLSERINSCSIALIRTLYRFNRTDEIIELRNSFPKLLSLKLEVRIFLKYPKIYDCIMVLYRIIR